MITTFNAMPPPVLRRARLRRLSIIAVLLALLTALSACGLAVKLGYGQGSAIAFRWLDGYVDFNDAQSLQVRAGLDEWFDWHRRTQLVDYADLLTRAEVEVLADTTPEAMCAWADAIRRRIDIAFAHARPVTADVALTLQPAQIARIEKKYAERNESWRDDYLQPDPAKRLQAVVDRQIERAEKLYGSLDDAQRRWVAQRVAASPYDAALAYAERLRRQADALALLRRLGGSTLTRAQAESEIVAYVQRLDRSPDETYRRYAGRMTDDNCAFAASLHNMTAPAQRDIAAKRLRGYEKDLRELAAASSTG